MATVAEWDKKTRRRVGPDDAWNLLLIIPATRRKSSRLFLFRQGVLEEGPLLLDLKLEEDGPPWLQARLERAPAEIAARAIPTMWPSVIP